MTWIPYDFEGILATIAWWKRLANGTNLYTSYALEKRFKPDGVKMRDDGDGFRTTGTLARYRRGDVVPGKPLAERIGEEFPSSIAILTSPLWAVLRAGLSAPPQMDAVLATAPPELSRIVYRGSYHGTRKRRRCSLSDLSHIAAYQSPLAVAALLTLTHEALLQGTARVQFDCARAAVNALVLLCTGNDIEPIGNLLLRRMRQRFLDHVDCDFAAIDFDAFDLAKSAAMATMFMMFAEDNYVIEGKPAQYLRFYHSLLEGGRGAERQHAVVVPIHFHGRHRPTSSLFADGQYRTLFATDPELRSLDSNLRILGSRARRVVRAALSEGVAGDPPPRHGPRRRNSERRQRSPESRRRLSSSRQRKSE